MYGCAIWILCGVVKADVVVCCLILLFVAVIVI